MIHELQVAFFCQFISSNYQIDCILISRIRNEGETLKRKTSNINYRQSYESEGYNNSLQYPDACETERFSGNLSYDSSSSQCHQHPQHGQHGLPLQHNQFNIDHFYPEQTLPRHYPEQTLPQNFYPEQTLVRNHYPEQTPPQQIPIFTIGGRGNRFHPYRPKRKWKKRQED